MAQAKKTTTKKTTPKKTTTTVKKAVTTSKKTTKKATLSEGEKIVTWVAILAATILILFSVVEYVLTIG